MHALWMIGASLAFAAMGACIKLAGEAGSPQGQIIFYRGFLSLLAVWAYMRWAGIPVVSRHWRIHLRRSLTSLVSLIAFFAAIRMLPLGTAVTLLYVSPLLLAVLLPLVHREWPGGWLLVALLSGLLGVTLLLRPTAQGAYWAGGAIGVLAAVLTALSALNMRALGQLKEPSWRSVFYFTLVIVIATLPWYLASSPLSIDRKAAALMAGVALFATAGQVMLTKAYEYRHTLLVAMLGYSQVIFTSLIGMILWHDILGWTSWLGMLMIIAAGAGAMMISQRNTHPLL